MSLTVVFFSIKPHSINLNVFWFHFDTLVAIDSEIVFFFVLTFVPKEHYVLLATGWKHIIMAAFHPSALATS